MAATSNLNGFWKLDHQKKVYLTIIAIGNVHVQDQWLSAQTVISYSW